MYFKEDGVTIDTKWVDSEALKTAKEFVFTKKLKSSQLRKFYADVKGLELTWERRQFSEAAFQGILPQIKILKAKAAYAKKRDVVPQEFHQWMERHVNAIETPAHFRAFLLHFEAVVGFCYGEGLKD